MSLTSKSMSGKWEIQFSRTSLKVFAELVTARSRSPGLSMNKIRKQKQKILKNLALKFSFIDISKHLLICPKTYALLCPTLFVVIANRQSKNKNPFFIPFLLIAKQSETIYLTQRYGFIFL